MIGLDLLGLLMMLIGLLILILLELDSITCLLVTIFSKDTEIEELTKIIFRILLLSIIAIYLGS